MRTLNSRLLVQKAVRNWRTSSGARTRDHTLAAVEALHGRDYESHKGAPSTRIVDRTSIFDFYEFLHSNSILWYEIGDASAELDVQAQLGNALYWLEDPPAGQGTTQLTVQHGMDMLL